MNNTVIDLFENIIVAKLDDWHEKNFSHFSYQFQEPINTLEGLVERNIYYNYQGWHFEDLGQSDNAMDVMKGWQGSRENNRNRNHSIQLIDTFFLSFYAQDAEEYTETIGVILDKISILYIKYLHLVEIKDQRSQVLLDIINRIINQTSIIYKKIMDGKLKCITIPHLKLYDKQQSCSENI
jgi:hypothetical protein